MTEEGGVRPAGIWPAADSTVTRPRSCRETGGALCTYGHRCPAHLLDVDPESIGVLLHHLFPGGGR